MLKLCDVTLRDGIQSFPKIISSSNKLNIYKNIIKTGINSIEIGSNVSPKIIQMNDLQTILKGIDLYHTSYPNLKKPNIITLVPNKKKYLELCNFYGFRNINTISLITAASNAFSIKNTGLNIEKSLLEIDEIIDYKLNNFRIYISCSFGCPFTLPIEDPNEVKKVITDNTIKIINRYLYNGNVKEIIISDTIGSYDEYMLFNILNGVNKTMHYKLGLHLHIDNKNIFKVLMSTLSTGITNFDVSFGNIGGCPSIDKKNIKSNINIIDFLKTTRQIGFKDSINTDELFQSDLIINKIINN
jgi:hydroxymethylglutaryl-CoA lyase